MNNERYFCFDFPENSSVFYRARENADYTQSITHVSSAACSLDTRDDVVVDSRRRRKRKTKQNESVSRVLFFFFFFSVS